MSNQFPDPNVSPEYTAPNGSQYIYDSTDGKWIAVGFVDPIIPDLSDDNLQSDTTDDRYANLVGDSMSGDLSVLEPEDDSNAVSKGYVDDAVTGEYLDREGDKMEAYLKVPTPSEDNQVANIVYVDTVSDDKVSKSGDEMTGTLVFESEPTELEPIVYKFNPSIVELTERSGEDVTTTLDLGTDFFYIDDNVEIKSTGEITFNSPVQTGEFVVNYDTEFNIDNLLTIERDTEDHILYHGPIIANTELVTKEYADRIVDVLTQSVPPGTIFFWASTQDIPDNYFKLDGSSFDTGTYPVLHTILQGTHGYTNGKLPDYSNRFACHGGSPNSGNPGQFLADLNAFTGQSDNQTMTMTAHTHTCTIGGGTHTHTWTLTGTGTHTHTYSSWTSSVSGGGTTSKNPDNYGTSWTMSTSTSSHTHTIDVTSGSHNTGHTVTVDPKSGIGNHNHSMTVSNGDNTTRPLAFLGYWIIKNK